MLCSSSLSGGSVTTMAQCYRSRCSIVGTTATTRLEYCLCKHSLCLGCGASSFLSISHTTVRPCVNCVGKLEALRGACCCIYCWPRGSKGCIQACFDQPSCTAPVCSATNKPCMASVYLSHHALISLLFFFPSLFFIFLDSVLRKAKKRSGNLALR